MPSLVGIEHDGGLRVTEARLPALDGRLTPITLSQPQERPPAAGLVIAHGGSDDGRHLFRDEAQQLARAGLAVALPE
jgi:dipeptidyl aminopeptidase/acylaminoacyl peptidase